MKVLYVGQYSEGTTSKMRGEQIRSILKPEEFQVIDTHLSFYKANRVYRTVGFRYKRGPLISKINTFVLKKLFELSVREAFDLIWVDKAVFLTKKTTQELKKKTKKLVHFTPDMAFYENRSHHFKKSMRCYDFLVTTKEAEVSEYLKVVPHGRIIRTTQGFSKEIHIPTVQFERKGNLVAFIGLAEKSRFEIAEYLIQNNIHIKIAGVGWERFARKHQNNPFFEYKGKTLYGKEYTKLISSTLFGLGLLSKNFPEFHTTRTFEIPACGTALITERNEEINSFYNEDEAIFYSTPEEMVKKIKYYLRNNNELLELTNKGYERVHKEGFDYESILKKILDQVLA